MTGIIYMHKSCMQIFLRNEIYLNANVNFRLVRRIFSANTKTLKKIFPQDYFTSSIFRVEEMFPVSNL